MKGRRSFGISCTAAALTVAIGLPSAAQTGAPTGVPRGAVVFVEQSEFGQALSAAILKKKVPVMIVTDREKADFYIEETSNVSKEGSAERVAKVLTLGGFAGSGRTYQAAVNLTNRDGVVLFAHNTRKGTIKSAAEDVANKLKDHVTKR